MRIFSNRDRPVHMGPLPSEVLARAANVAEVQSDKADASTRALPIGVNLLADVCRSQARHLDIHRKGDPWADIAPGMDSAEMATNDIKAFCYFLDAALVGATTMLPSDWSGEPEAGHNHAFAIVVEERPAPPKGNLAHDLIAGCGRAGAMLRAAEIATNIAHFIRKLGYPATAHTPYQSDVKATPILVRAGVVRLEKDRLIAPFVGDGIAVAIVSTAMPLEIDRPLAPRRALEGGARWWFGRGGTDTVFSRRYRRHKRAEHSIYPMEKVKRVDEVTTLILHDEVPRLPKRADGFLRAAYGDFGSKAAREFGRFWQKTPYGNVMNEVRAEFVPFQDGDVAPTPDAAWCDPARNAAAVKALLYYVGADLVGTCEAKRYTWYSHDVDGKPIPIYHRSAAVVIIDQGFETMEGASGDDWISMAQSARAYMRGAITTGVIAELVRALGYSARSHTSLDSDVIQTPLVVLAGLGEMSRIGETVLNPFIGPRSKSAVLTMNLPLEWDRPVDFGLQDSCAKCLKCARECPCDAITYNGPVMFNGYEQWKQDVQRCTAYRVTNQGGAACGRCLKTCPFNNEGLALHRAGTWAVIHLPFVRKWLNRVDDWMGNGDLNPIKKWWQDFEIVNGKMEMAKRTNRRGLDIKKGDSLKDKQRIAYTNASALPPPNWTGPFPSDRAAGIAAGEQLESIPKARERHARGAPAPEHYHPPEPAADGEIDPSGVRTHQSV